MGEKNQLNLSKYRNQVEDELKAPKSGAKQGEIICVNMNWIYFFSHGTKFLMTFYRLIFSDQYTAPEEEDDNVENVDNCDNCSTSAYEDDDYIDDDETVTFTDDSEDTRPDETPFYQNQLEDPEVQNLMYLQAMAEFDE